MRKTLTGEIPLVSRDTEMDWILAKLKRPEPAAFVLAGAPGVGKTRLAAEAAKSAAGLGFITAQAVASRAAAAIPATSRSRGMSGISPVSDFLTAGYFRIPGMSPPQDERGAERCLS